VIVYYSGWLEKPQSVELLGEELNINDKDKNGLMSVVQGLYKSKGLDLFLHTPGGDIAATESIVEYLRAMFPGDIRVIVPQLAMSCGTMIALASNEIVMGNHSSLGPIDPQFGSYAAHGIIEEFETASAEIAIDPRKAAVWAPILDKYRPTTIGKCYKAIEWSRTIVHDWLVTGMFSENDNPSLSANKVLDELASQLTLVHNRHISLKKAQDLGLNVTALESNQKLQDLVLSIHHALIITLWETQAIKIIENHKGDAFINFMPGQR